MKELDITEVAQRSGVPASALRFYKEKGLIASTGRRGMRRLFDPGVLEQLALIPLWQSAGFTLSEIAGCSLRTASRRSTGSGWRGRRMSWIAPSSG
jgi:DNA-binding transcriptional MerR regulator